MMASGPLSGYLPFISLSSPSPPLLGFSLDSFWGRENPEQERGENREKGEMEDISRGPGPFPLSPSLALSLAPVFLGGQRARGKGERRARPGIIRFIFCFLLFSLSFWYLENRK